MPLVLLSMGINVAGTGCCHGVAHSYFIWCKRPLLARKRMNLYVTVRVWRHGSHAQYEDGEVQFLTDSLNDIEQAEILAQGMDLFEQNVLLRIFSQWRKLIDTTVKEWHHIRNPYVAGRPLEPDSSVFVGRVDIFRWIAEKLRSPSEQHVLILHGGFHTGKTSILKQLSSGPMGAHLRDRKRHPLFPVYVDLQRLADAGTGPFLLGLAEAIQARLPDGPPETAIPSPAKEVFRGAHYRAFDQYLEKVKTLMSARNGALLVLMLDEFELLDDRVRAKKIDDDIFPYLRSLMQHEQFVSFILAGRHRLDEMQAAFKDPIFNVATHKELDFLTDDEARVLIRDPVVILDVQYESGVVEEILCLTGGHPFFIQQQCLECIDCLNEEQVARIVTEEHLQKSLERALARNAVLDSLWKQEIAEDDREILIALAGLSDERDVGLPFSELTRQLEREPVVFTQSLDRLVSQRFLERKARGTQSPSGQEWPSYGFRIKMLRSWVKRNYC